MPAGSPDSLLERLGIRPVRKHRWIVITFKQHSVERGDDLFESVEDMPQIGQDSESVPSVINNKRHAIHSIMRRRNRLDSHLSKLERRTSLEVPNVADSTEHATLPRSSQSFLGDMNRHGEFPMEDTHSARVIAVFVRNQQGVDALDLAAVRCEPLLGLPTADARIEEQPYSPCFNISAVSIAARLQGDNFHRGILIERPSTNEVERLRAAHSMLANGERIDIRLLICSAESVSVEPSGSTVASLESRIFVF